MGAPFLSQSVASTLTWPNLSFMPTGRTVVFTKSEHEELVVVVVIMESSSCAKAPDAEIRNNKKTCNACLIVNLAIITTNLAARLLN
jgi:hypothetical protein